MPLARWLWVDRGPTARLVRGALLPASLAYRAAAATRARAYHARLLPTRGLPAPTVSVGNLTVGGTGKTPIAAWIAEYFRTRGVRPGVLLRGYGGDEAAVHRFLVPDAVVIEDPDRSRGAEQAIRCGARVLVLDDGFQRLDVGRDLDIGLVSAESDGAAPWPLPAGPWRESLRALGRADLVVITRKCASLAAAWGVAERVRRTVADRPVAIAQLAIGGLRGMFSNDPVDPGAMRGLKVVVASAVADPDALAWQCRSLGADVRLLAWRDHHAFTAQDARFIVAARGSADCVVVTEKDAGKLRGCWCDECPEPLVADLEVRWEEGDTRLALALDAVLSGVKRIARGVDSDWIKTEALET